jgi:hypothetical protein
MDTSDRIELHELAARYGDLIDARDWPGLQRIFTPEAIFDLSDIHAGELRGLEAIREHMEHEPHHPIAHHITNIYVEEDGENVRLHSRVIGVLADRRAGSGEYRDDVLHTDVGWRVSRRVFRLTRPPRPA